MWVPQVKLQRETNPPVSAAERGPGRESGERGATRKPDSASPPWSACDPFLLASARRPCFACPANHQPRFWHRKWSSARGSLGGGGTHQQPIPSLRQSERHSSRPESPRTHQPHDSGVLFRAGHHQHLLLTLLDLATPCSPPLAADRDPRLLPLPLSLSLSLRRPPSATTRSAAVCAPRTKLLATLLSNTISSSPPPLARTSRPPPPVAGSSAMIDRCAANVAAV